MFTLRNPRRILSNTFSHCIVDSVCNLAAILMISIIGSGCVPSSKPTFEEILKISAPNFFGKVETLVSSPTQSYTLEGSCDTSAKLTEYSFDQTTWTEATCTDGKFLVHLTLLSYADVWARSKGKFNYSEIAHARVRFLLPPTSDTIVAGNSSRSSNFNAVHLTTQNMLANTFEGSAVQNGSKTIHTLLPRVVYDK